MAEILKKCTKCKKRKRLTEFYKRKYKNSKSYQSLCKSCLLANNKDWRNRNRHTAEYKAAANRRVKINRFKAYGISEEQFEKLFINQGKRCAICTRKLKMFKERHIDHCHKKKIVRGILCLQCNAGLGHFRDNVVLLLSAINYLRKRHPIWTTNKNS